MLANRNPSSLRIRKSPTFLSISLAMARGATVRIEPNSRELEARSDSALLVSLLLSGKQGSKLRFVLHLLPSFHDMRRISGLRIDLVSTVQGSSGMIAPVLSRYEERWYAQKRQ